MTRKSRVVVIFTSVWLIVVAACGARVAFAFEQQRKIPHQILATVSFDQEAGNIALALSQGAGFSKLFRQNTGPTAWLAPGYPFLLSLVFRVFGAFTFSSFIAAVSINIFASTLVVLPLFQIVSRVSGRTAGAIAGWAWVFFPAGIMMPSEWIWDTSISALLGATILWMTFKVSESKDWQLWIIYGFLAGLAILTNPALGIALPFLLGWAAWHGRKVNNLQFVLPIVAVAVMVLCCIPWTVRNYVQLERLVPIRSSLPFELWIGNNEIFDEHAIGGMQRITRFEETRNYAQLGENAYLDDKKRRAELFIHSKPMLFLRLTEGRIIATWIGTEHPVRDFMHSDSAVIRLILVCNLILMAGTVLGIFQAVRSKCGFWFPWLIFPVFYPMVYYITHTSLRYRHPIDPILIALTVSTAATLFRKRASSNVTARLQAC